MHPQRVVALDQLLHQVKHVDLAHVGIAADDVNTNLAEAVLGGTVQLVQVAQGDAQASGAGVHLGDIAPEAHFAHVWLECGRLEVGPGRAHLLGDIRRRHGRRRRAAYRRPDHTGPLACRHAERAGGRRRKDVGGGDTGEQSAADPGGIDPGVAEELSGRPLGLGTVSIPL